MVNESNDSKIRLSTTVSGITVEIWLDSSDDFREGYANLKRLSSRIPVEEARYFVKKIWIIEGDAKHLPDFITESSHRIALSLLDTWPETKLASDISSETNLSSTGVRFILSGQRGSASDWFYKSDEGEWGLTNLGIDMILKDVIPYIRESVGKDFTSEPLF